MNKNIIKDSISCLENVTLEDNTYKIAINITLDYLKELEEKNKKLKDELELKDFNYTTFRHLEESNDILKEELKETEEEVDKLEDRINKAIEYIEENKCVFGTNLDMNYLLRILKGEE